MEDFIQHLLRVIQDIFQSPWQWFYDFRADGKWSDATFVGITKSVRWSCLIPLCMAMIGTARLPKNRGQVLLVISLACHVVMYVLPIELLFWGRLLGMEEENSSILLYFDLIANGFGLLSYWIFFVYIVVLVKSFRT